MCQLHKKAAEKAQQAPTKTQTPKQPEIIAANIDEVDLHRDLAEKAQKDSVIKQLINTEFGTWFKFDVDSQSPQEVKLAWSNTTTLHFMFVNRLGQQVAVKTGDELAEDIRAGKTKILSKNEDKPFFEKALERILNQIQHKQ